MSSLTAIALASLASAAALRDLEQQVLALGATGGELLGVGAWSRRYCSNF
jgi:hypothetical protein